MAKRIMILHAAGPETILDRSPNMGEVQHIVGGYVGFVRVLDRVDRGAFHFTLMLVNDNGLLEKLPRNDEATKIYQRDVRARWPGVGNPFAEARKAARARFPHAEHIDLTPEWALADGFADDPWICGDVIFYDGYAFEEAAALIGRVT